MTDFFLAIISSLLGNLGQFTYTRAYQVTEASKVAVFQYCEILFAYLFDICFLGHKLEFYSIFGTCLIILSGYLLK